MSDSIDPFLIKAMVAPLMPKKVPAPEGTYCLSCGSKDMTRTVIPAGGPYSGRVTCHFCGKDTTTMTYLAQRMVGVQPLDKPTSMKRYLEGSPSKRRK